MASGRKGSRLSEVTLFYGFLFFAYLVMTKLIKMKVGLTYSGE